MGLYHPKGQTLPVSSRYEKQWPYSFKTLLAYCFVMRPDDIKILYNDWPYGIDEKIVHLVIWTKFSFEEDPETEQLTWEARIDLEDWVYETFCTRMKPGNVSDIHLQLMITPSALTLENRLLGSKIGKP